MSGSRGLSWIIAPCMLGMVVVGLGSEPPAVAPGDRVYLVRDTKMRVGEEIRTAVAADTVAIVRDVRAGWYWISTAKPEGHFEGWISAEDAIDLDAAIAAAAERLAGAAGDVGPFVRRGRLLAAKGHYDRALADLTGAIRANPSSAEAYCHRAGVYLSTGEAALALADSEAAIRCDGQLARAYQLRADARALLGQAQAALADYERAIRLDANGAGARNGRAVVHLNAGELGAALEESTNALASDPSFVPAYLARAEIWLARNDSRKALEEFQLALKYDPKNAVAIHGQGTIYHQRSQWEEALRFYTRAITLEPRQATARANRGDCRYRLGQLEEALADYEEAVRLGTDEPEAFRGRAAVLFDLGETRKAQADLAWARRLEMERGQGIGSATRVAEAEAPGKLRQALAERDYVSVELAPGAPDGSLRLLARQYTFEDRILRREPTTAWQALIPSAEAWEPIRRILVEHAGQLVDCQDWPAVDGTYDAAVAPLAPRWIGLLFHRPAKRVLEVHRNLQVALSEEAQRHVFVSGASSYPASRRVLIVGEPHWNLQQHWSLLKGLAAIFSDNPPLLSDGRSIFLSEGFPAGESLSVEPLFRAAPSPDDPTIDRVLQTYLVPGYVAYEWKHRRGIPIVGVEDPEAYGLSAQAWTRVAGDSRPRDGSSALLRITVGARNRSIAETLARQSMQHECPFLFVGTGHLGAPFGSVWDLGEGTSSSSVAAAGTAEDRLSKMLKPGQLSSLRATGCQPLAQLLEERGIGFWLLEARSEPLPDPDLQRRAVQRYLALVRAQQNQAEDAYLRDLIREGRTVTSKPSPEKASNYLAFQSNDGGQDKGNEGKGNEGKGSGGSGGGNSGGGKSGGGKSGGGNSGGSGSSGGKSGGGSSGGSGSGGSGGGGSSLGERLSNALGKLADGIGNGLKFTKHALERMGERGISPESVAEAVSKGSKSPGRTAGTTVHDLPSSRSSSGRGLRVVTSASGAVVTVIDKGSHFGP